MNQLNPRVSAICDGCQMSIFEACGDRYKCQICPNFDFCGSCITTGHHILGHYFTKLPCPNQNTPFRIIDVALVFYQMEYDHFSKADLARLVTATIHILNHPEFKKSPKEFVRRWVASRGGEEVFIYIEDPCLDFFCLYARIQRQEHCDDEDGFSEEFYQSLCQNF